ncbi:MAG: sugar phosphate isomerase/epimerase [Armatimonadetes bacterium]|nr:sugar phosphate isomerase/epimerase [Armatimonadota bacterium]MDW8122714.1 sugar phosphate isomerase/epimerase [Armatimonadota bacterium]
MAQIPIAVQLYSVRNDCAKDLPGTLKEIAQMGYEGVEFAGYYGYQAHELRRLLDDLGLKVAGTHTGVDTLSPSRLAETLEFNQTLGNRYLIVPWVGEEWRKTRDDWLRLAEFLTEVSEKVRGGDFTVGYHNHHFEFQQTFDGENLWDLLLRHTPGEVAMQLDTGNAMHGGATGQDLLAIIQRYPGRAKTVHLKEYSSANPTALIGEGEVPWKEFLSQCIKTGGTEWFIIEQESYAFPPLECIRKCLDNLKGILAGMG